MALCLLAWLGYAVRPSQTSVLPRLPHTSHLTSPHNSYHRWPYHCQTYAAAPRSWSTTSMTSRWRLVWTATCWHVRHRVRGHTKKCEHQKCDQQWTCSIPSHMQLLNSHLHMLQQCFSSTCPTLHPLLGSFPPNSNPMPLSAPRTSTSQAFAGFGGLTCP